MIKNLLVGFTCMLSMATVSFGQGIKIPVYATYKEGDSIQSAIKLLFSELGKANAFEYSLNSPSSFKNKGILVIRSEQARQYKISLPSTLPGMGPEGLYVRSEPGYLIIAGNTGLALQAAVYFYLERLGYRWLMPGDDWKIVPKLNSPYTNVNLLTKPHYDYRWIANGHGYMNSKKIANDFNSWAWANNLGGSFEVRVGHSYDEIVMRNAEIFKQHPEYFAQPPPKGTLPVTFKFNVANKDLVNLVVKDAIARYELQQEIKDLAPMVSMEPSDGGGSCSTPECLAIGTPSDQAFYLTNMVARAMQKKYPGVWVGTYAYNEHIIPTKYKLEPNVFVMITNGFNNSKYSTKELMELWGKKASRIGVYEYLSVYEWDLDLPGQPAAGNFNYLQSSVKRYYQNGARAYQGESVMGWVNRGPGQYLLSKLLWNINVNVDSTMKDFFEKGFENTAPLISKLYASWQSYKHGLPQDNDMADWLRIVDEASRTARSAAVRKRIDYIKMYMNYLVMYRDLKTNTTEQNMIRILSYAFRSFEQTAFATLPTMVSLPNRMGFAGWGWYDYDDQKWKHDKRPYTAAEMEETFQTALRTIKKEEGVTRFPYATSFVKLDQVIKLPKTEYLLRGHAIWDRTEYIIRINKKGDQNFIEMHSGFSAQPPVEKDVEIRIFALKPGITNYEDEKPNLVIRQHKKNVVEKFSLASLEPGTYKLFIDDRRKLFVLNFSTPIDYSIVLNADFKLNTTSSAGLNYFCFYVPKGVKKFQVTKNTVLQLITPTLRVIDKQNNKEETFFVEVQPGEEGIWKIVQQAGTLYMEGIPPYLGDLPTRMLVPSYLKK